ncbi:unnamed protein product, partial [Scytosiphon promiscuus]
RSGSENTFDALREEVQKKRSVGLSYNAIFSELAAKANQEAHERDKNNHRRRGTAQEGATRHSMFPITNSTVTPWPSAPQKMECQDPPARPERSSWHLDVGRRRISREQKELGEEIFPGFVEEKNASPRKEDGARQKDLGGPEKVEAGGPDPPGCAISFGDTLQPGTDQDGDGRGLSDTQRLAESVLANKPSRRAQIFDKGVDASVMQDLMNDDAESEIERSGPSRVGLGRTGLLQNPEFMGEQSADIVVSALKKFFFLEYDKEEASKAGSEGPGGGGMAMLMRAMEREEWDAGMSLMEQGEEGHHMFVVEEGSLEVVIDDEAIRVIGVGDRFGELALLYNAPRSASVRTLSPCVLWSIHREVFKAVQALTASGNLIARSTHLYHVPWLRLLSTADLSKLASCFQTTQYKDGDMILREGEETDRCFLIESGEVICSTAHVQRSKEDGKHSKGEEVGSEDDEDRGGGVDVCESVERFMMVARPGLRRKSPCAGTPPDAGGAMAGASSSPTTRPGTARHSLAGSTGSVESGRRPTLPRGQGRLNMGGVNGMGAIRSECQSYWDADRREVVFGKGCFLGVPVLLASAELEIDGLPGWELSESSQLQRQGENVSQGQQADASFSAVSPVQIVAKGEVRIGHFDVSRFTKTVGPFAKVLGGIGDSRGAASPVKFVRDRKSISRQSLAANPGTSLALKHEKLTVHSFEQMAFLGQGSFGFVTMVRKKEGIMEGSSFALKSLSKLGVVEGGQVQHIKDEKAVLELFDHPFVLRLYTTFQDTNRVYFLTELLTGGELWSVIYESSSGYGSGLPPEQVTFYSAVVVDAIAYMHKKGIAYRDLKPENLIVDNAGYLRIIDMGFAKRIPFFVTVGGETQMHPRSHTMCGTPDYLAPEFIFNKGHDQSADIWALGVLIFELVEARTPFTPAGSEQDVAQLFTNIACVKKRGVQFPDGFDEKAGGRADCRHLISGMLAFEPGDRLGNQKSGMDDVKAHVLYEGLGWEQLEAKSIPAPWVPDAPAPFTDPEAPHMNEVYTGDQVRVTIGAA